MLFVNSDMVLIVCVFYILCIQILALWIQLGIMQH